MTIVTQLLGLLVIILKAIPLVVLILVFLKNTRKLYSIFGFSERLNNNAPTINVVSSTVSIITAVGLSPAATDQDIRRRNNTRNNHIVDNMSSGGGLATLTQQQQHHCYHALFPERPPRSRRREKEDVDMFEITEEQKRSPRQTSSTCSFYSTLKIYGIPSGFLSISDKDNIQYSGPIDIQLKEVDQGQSLILTATASSDIRTEERKTIRLTKPLQINQLYISESPNAKIIIENASQYCIDSTCVLFSKNAKLEFRNCYFKCLDFSSNGDVLAFASTTQIWDMIWVTAGTNNNFGSPTIMNRFQYQCSRPGNNISANLESNVSPISDMNTPLFCKSYFYQKPPPSVPCIAPSSSLPNPSSPPRALPAGITQRLNNSPPTVVPRDPFATRDVPDGWKGPVCMICQCAYPNTTSIPCGQHVYCAQCMVRAQQRGELVSRKCIACSTVYVHDVHVIDIDTFLKTVAREDLEKHYAQTSSTG